MANPNASSSKSTSTNSSDMNTGSSNLSSSSMGSNIHDATSKLRDTATSMMGDSSARAREIVDDVSNRASAIYDQAGEWLESNRTAGYIALGALCGLVGFLIGRNMSSSSSSSIREF